MKKFLFLSLFLLFASANLAAMETSTLPQNENEHADFFRKKTFSGSITLSGGCRVKYVITVDYDLFPPTINSVSGTVTLSGPCSGTQTFSARATTDERGTVTNLESDIRLESVNAGELNSRLAQEINQQHLFDR